MTATVDIHEAKIHFSKPIERVRLGEEIAIAKAGEPIARLVPERRRRKQRQSGTGKGQIVIHDPFYNHLPDDLLDCSRPKSEAAPRHACPVVVDRRRSELAR